MRGEVFIPLDVFQRENAMGGARRAALANPRNAAAARSVNSIRKLVARRKLDMFVYDLIVGGR